MRTIWTPMVTVHQPAKLGSAEIRHLVIDERKANHTRMRQAATCGREQAIHEGAYCQLFVNGTMVMSDTQMEHDTNEDFVDMARGDIFIAGLGLGMILMPLLARKSVTSIFVIEKNLDVINLVEPAIRRATGTELGTAEGARLAVVQADVLTWQPPVRTRWDYIYFDIWADINRDNLRDMYKLHQRFRPKRRPHGSVTSWLFDDLKNGYV